jgi:small-conductance mechanosensitive channel
VGLALLGGPARAAAASPLGALTSQEEAPSGAAKGGAQPAAAPAPQAIAVEHVFRAADELEGPLRKADAVAEADPAVAEVERHLEAAARAAEALRPGLEPERLREASAREIQRIQGALDREDLILADGQAVLERRAERLAAAAHELQDRLASWRLTAEAAQREAAPAAVLRRIAQVEQRLRVEEGRLRARQAKVLALQGRVSELRGEAARAAEAVADAEAALRRQLFEVESVPLWRGLAAPDRAGALAAQLHQALRETGRDVASFLADERLGLWLHLAVIAGLGLGLLALRRPVAAMGAEDPALRGAAVVVARPWSAAILLSLTQVGWLYQTIPPTLRDLYFLAFLAPLLRLLPELVPVAFRRPLQILAVLFALDRLASLAPPRTMLARLAILVVTGAALAVLLRGLRPRGWLRVLPGGPWGMALRAGAAAALGLLLASLASNVVGNATLAEELTHSTLAAATRGVVLLGLWSVLLGALAALLHLPAVARRPLVARHRELLERRAASLLQLALLLGWSVSTVVDFGLSGVAVGWGEAVLGFRLQVGGLDVTVGNVVAFVVTLWLAWAVARALRFVLDEGVFQEVALPRGVPAAISTTVQYALLLLGFSWAVLASGMEMSRFSFLVGALGVGIGFGLQNVVNNFVSGLILLYERPVQVGDVVEVGAVSGEVSRIGVRSSTVRTFSGAEVIVPNATLISAEVTNWTLSDKRRRISLAVGVAYGTEPRRVLDLLLAAVQGREGVLESPAPAALFLKLGESSLDFELRFWTADFERWQVLASDVMAEVYASLGRAGIQIPFPQRDLHVRSIDVAAAEALKAAGTEKSEGR